MNAPAEDLLARLAALAPALSSYVPRQRWARQAERIEAVRVEDAAVLPALGESFPLTFVRVAYAGGDNDLCWLPLAPVDEGAGTIGTPIGVAHLDGGPVRVADAFASPRFCRALLVAVARGERIRTAGGRVVAFASTSALRDEGIDAVPAADLDRLSIRRIGAEQSNSSIVFAERLIAKAFRRLAQGPNPDLEVTRFLSEPATAGGEPRFAHVAPVVGWATRLDQPGEDTLSESLLVVQRFVPNAGDGWSYTLDALRAFIRRLSEHGDRPDLESLERAVVEQGVTYLMDAARLGSITAQMHLALASSSDDPAFAPEPTRAADVREWRAGLAKRVDRVLDLLQRADQPKRVRGAIGRVLADRETLISAGDAFAILSDEGVLKTRFHGDYHLGQTLKVDTGFLVLDFEGEPLRPIAERRAKASPLKDVAGMLRSFNYARHTVVRELAGRLPIEPARVEGLGETWERAVRRIFLDAYLTEARPGAAHFLPRNRTHVDIVLRLYELDKAIYEVEYELNHRPEWLPIPLAFVAGSLAT